MNIMFLTIENVIDLRARSIYMDLVNTFIKHGHYVTILSVREKRDRKQKDQDYYAVGDYAEIIKINTGNITKVSNYIEKGIELMKLFPLANHAARKAIKSRKYDLVLYGSPPVTFFGAVNIVKHNQNAHSYLLLKDIWPYDCVFGGVLSKKGWKKLAFDYLAYLARQLYDVSDKIGCMSPANIRFLMENEPGLPKEKVEINPNSIIPYGHPLTEIERVEMRNKYNIPVGKTVFVYGGSLGKPQGIDFALEAICAAKQVEEAVFVFVGSGTAEEQIAKAMKAKDYNNLIFLDTMGKDEYEQFVYSCDVGLIFLNHECLAPNYPSRLLSYMQASLPVLCATDVYTDVGKIAQENGYGLWCESNDLDGFVKCIKLLCDKNSREEKGKLAYQFLLKEYSVNHSYEIIMKSISYFEGVRGE